MPTKVKTPIAPLSNDALKFDDSKGAIAVHLAAHRESCSAVRARVKLCGGGGGGGGWWMRALNEQDQDLAGRQSVLNGRTSLWQKVKCCDSGVWNGPISASAVWPQFTVSTAQNGGQGRGSATKISVKIEMSLVIFCVYAYFLRRNTFCVENNFFLLWSTKAAKTYNIHVARWTNLGG